MTSPHPPLAGQRSEGLWCQDLMRPPLWRGRHSTEKRPEKRAKASNHVRRFFDEKNGHRRLSLIFTDPQMIISNHRSV